MKKIFLLACCYGANLLAMDFKLDVNTQCFITAVGLSVNQDSCRKFKQLTKPEDQLNFATNLFEGDFFKRDYYVGLSDIDMLMYDSISALYFKECIENFKHENEFKLLRGLRRRARGNHITLGFLNAIVKGYASHDDCCAELVDYYRQIVDGGVVYKRDQAKKKEEEVEVGKKMGEDFDAWTAEKLIECFGNSID